MNIEPILPHRKIQMRFFKTIETVDVAKHNLRLWSEQFSN